MIEFTKELYDKYDKMIWQIARKHLAQAQARNQKDVFWRITAEDLHSEGIYAMANACKAFDPNKGIMFSTYLHTCVENQINLYFRKQSRAFAIGQEDNKRIVAINKCRAQGMSVDEIAKETGLDINTVLTLIDANDFAYSLDYQNTDQEGDKMDVHEIIQDSSYTKEEERIYETLDALIHDYVAATDEEKELYMRFRGILGRKKTTKNDLYKEYSHMKRSDFDKWIRRIQYRIDKYIERNWVNYY